METVACPHWTPQLNDLLADLGLGSVAEYSVSNVSGRNSNVAVTTSTGAQVFAKRILGDAQSAGVRLRRAIAIEVGQLISRCGLMTPRCLGWDEDARLIVFELLTPARTAADLADTGEFDQTTAEQTARLVATLHTSTLSTDPPAPPFPELMALTALSPHEYATATAEELHLWRIVQNDAALKAALRSLHHAQELAALAPTHCDLRLDQFIDHAGRLYLTDLEELQLADPARDIGTFAGEWLYRAVNQIPTGADDLSDARIIELATAEFIKVRPLVSIFWRTYVDVSESVDPGLGARAVAFAGWHQFNRAFASAQVSARLSAHHRAAAGIGRTALLMPGKFISALGLGNDA